MSEHILIVEDSPTQAAQIRHSLQTHGYEVEVAVDGQEGLAAARARRPVLIIADIAMPVMDGYEMCRAINQDKTLKDIPVILLTSLTELEDVIRGLQVGADYYLTKPCDEDLLLSRVRSVIESPVREERVGQDLAVFFGGQLHIVTSSRRQILNLLLSTYESAMQQRRELVEAQRELQVLNEQLERKVRERTRQLRVSEANYRALLETNTDALVVLDRGGVVRFANLAVETLFGHPAQDLLGEPFLFPASVGEVVDVEIARPGDEPAVAEMHVVATRWEGEEARLAVLRDVTERVRTEEMLRESEEKFRQFFENAPGYCYMVALDGTTLDINAAALAALGYEKEEIVGQPLLTTVYAPASVERARQLLAKWHKTGRLRNEELTIITKDGRERTVLLSADAVRGADGRLLHSVSVHTDITELRQLEKQMRQQERLAAVGQLAGGIAHDFNNLLTAIMLYAQRPLEVHDLSPDLKQALETILSESRQAAKLVQQILDFSRHSPIQTQVVDLKSFVKEAVRVLQRTIPENISFALDVEPGKYVMNADPTRIQQVLMNLVVNARDAMPQGGRLRIRLERVRALPASILLTDEGETPEQRERPDGWVCLSVSDTGTGMPPDVLSHIFEPFFTTKSRGEGTGLGLAQVYGIVKQHQGHIGVETIVGQGTTFRVYLPACGTGGGVAEVKRQEATTVAYAGRGETILLVEDSERVRQVTRKMLEFIGYRVLEVENGREALDVYRSAEKVDLVFTDLIMPEMGGGDLIRELRKMDPSLKALVTTGYVLADELEELVRDGVTGVVRKPFDAEILAQAVRGALDAGRRRGDRAPAKW